MGWTAASTKGRRECNVGLDVIGDNLINIGRALAEMAET